MGFKNIQFNSDFMFNFHLTLTFVKTNNWFNITLKKCDVLLCKKSITNLTNKVITAEVTLNYWLGAADSDIPASKYKCSLLLCDYN